ncbi:MAG: YitT family protein [Bacilli bacterium]
MSTNLRKQVGLVILGSFILAFGVYHITFANNIADGGFIGIAYWVEHTFGISPSVTTMMLDFPVFLIVLRAFGLRTISLSVIGSVSFSVFYWLMETYSPFILDFSDALIFASLLGGAISGIGLGIILRFGGATGGDDLVSILISKKGKCSVGTVYFVFDAAIIALCSSYLTIEQVFYTLIMIGVCAWVTDLVYEFEPTITVPAVQKSPARSAA